jgi:hypothetical protein
MNTTATNIELSAHMPTDILTLDTDREYQYTLEPPAHTSTINRFIFTSTMSRTILQWQPNSIHKEMYSFPAVKHIPKVGTQNIKVA